MMQVWIIEQGCYSDYRVVGIYSTQENAQRVCDLINKKEPYEEASVVFRKLDPCIEEMNEGLIQFYVMMDWSGDVESCKESSCIDPDDDGLSCWGRTKVRWQRNQKKNDCVRGGVWAKDTTHAIKIANEYRAQQIAHGELKSFEETEEF